MGMPNVAAVSPGLRYRLSCLLTAEFRMRRDVLGVDGMIGQDLGLREWLDRRGGFV